MPHLIILCLATVVLHARLHADDPDFVPLFNGRDLDGWVNVNCAPDTWSVRDGMIYCTGKPIGELRTTRMYQNFVLELEWRHLQPQGNAGVFVWADALTAPGVPFIRGVEVQVLDGREGTGFTSDGDVFPIHGATLKPENGRGGMRAFPTERRSHPSPEWNHYRIECVDGSISLAVNGKVVTRGDESSLRKGYICLESEGSPAEFKNLRIQELPGGELPPEQVASEDQGFTSLYNGANLDGWKTHSGLLEHWQPNDWQLAYDGRASGEDQDLWTTHSYRDFVLIVDWRWNGSYETTRNEPVLLRNGEVEKNPDGSERTQQVNVADSGIYLRGSRKARVAIWQNPIGSGAIRGPEVVHAPEHLAVATPRETADHKVGEWNRFEITVQAASVSVVLNGVKVIDNCPLAGIPSEGPIALQHHDSAIEFANLFIRPLP